MKLILKDSQEADLVVEGGVDAKGNDAPIEGLTFESTNPALVAVSVNPGGKSAVVSAVGPLGSAQIKMKADAQIGAGEDPFEDVLDVDVIAGKATGFKVSVGTPREQTPPVPSPAG